VEGLPEEEGRKGQPVVVDLVRPPIDAGGGSSRGEELGSDGSGVGTRRERKVGTTLGVGEVMVEKGPSRGAFIRLIGPDALPGLKELLLDFGGVSDKGAVRLPESRGAGGPMKESAAGGKFRGDGFPPGRGEVLMRQGLV